MATAPAREEIGGPPRDDQQCARLLPAGGAWLLSALQQAAPGRRLFLCPLRAITGIPCPLCGGTTAAISLARGEVGEALVANPFAVVGAAIVVLAPMLYWSGVRWRTGRATLLVVGGLLVVAEVWQLLRLSVISW